MRKLQTSKNRPTRRKIVDYLQSHEKALMLVFAPWCGHCKTALPIFVQCSKDLSVNMCIINSNEVSNNFLTKSLNVRIFPLSLRRLMIK